MFNTRISPPVLLLQFDAHASSRSFNADSQRYRFRVVIHLFGVRPSARHHDRETAINPLTTCAERRDRFLVDLTHRARCVASVFLNRLYVARGINCCFRVPKKIMGEGMESTA